MQVISNVATQDDYTDSLTLEQDTADTLTYVVANASVRARFRPVAHRGGAVPAYGDEVLLTVSANTARNVSGVQFKSAVPGQPAQIIAILTAPIDPQLAAGTPFTQTLAASGQTSQVGVITKIALGAFPPANPQDGQVVLVPIDTTHEWLLAFNASTSYWDFIGGLPLTAYVDASEATNSAVYAQLFTAGPSIAIPRPGDYLIRQGARMIQASGAVNNVQFFMSYDVGAVAAIDADAAESSSPTNQVWGTSPTKARTKSGLVAGTNIVSKYRMSAAIAGNFAERWLEVVAVRVQ